MIKSAEEARFGVITDLVNRIMVEGVIPAELELSTIVNCCKGKGDALEKGNYEILKLTYQILKVAEISIENLIRQQVDIDEMQYSFMSGCGTTYVTFYFETVNR